MRKEEPPDPAPWDSPEDRLRCKYCGNVIESHPEDHTDGCWAVVDVPEPPADPRERSNTDMVGIPPDDTDV